jgi:hypothetical protein
MHMGDGCLRLLRLRPDLVHKSPLHSETAFHTRNAPEQYRERFVLNNRWDSYYRGSRPFVKELCRFDSMWCGEVSGESPGGGVRATASGWDLSQDNRTASFDIAAVESQAMAPALFCQGHRWSTALVSRRRNSDPPRNGHPQFWSAL